MHLRICKLFRPHFRLRLPEEHDVSCDGEISSGVDDDDAVLGEREVRVTLPAVDVLELENIIIKYQ